MLHRLDSSCSGNSITCVYVMHINVRIHIRPLLSSNDNTPLEIETPHSTRIRATAPQRFHGSMNTQSLQGRRQGLIPCQQHRRQLLHLRPQPGRARSSPVSADASSRGFWQQEGCYRLCEPAPSEGTERAQWARHRFRHCSFRRGGSCIAVLIVLGPNSELLGIAAPQNTRGNLLDIYS